MSSPRKTRIQTPQPMKNNTYSYSYDGLNRRVKKATAKETREFYFNRNWQCVEEYVGSTCDARYIWGLRYVDDLVFAQIGVNRLFALHDANWNVMATVGYVAKAVLERITYSAFGKATFRDATFTARATSSYA